MVQKANQHGSEKNRDGQESEDLEVYLSGGDGGDVLRLASRLSARGKVPAGRGVCRATGQDGLQGDLLARFAAGANRPGIPLHLAPVLLIGDLP